VATKSAIFIDRDGTLIEEVHHLTSVEQVRVYPRSFEAVRQINAAGMLAIVVTNQSVVARGLLTESHLHQIHRFIVDRFERESARLDAVYYCPHHPEAGASPPLQECDCRKPKPGMLIRAAGDFGLDLGESVLIGDALSDIAAGHRAGTRSVLVKTGYGSQSAAKLDEEQFLSPEQRPDHIASDLLEAVRWAIRRVN
jgi:histidinol-phosphate phosphatase family protein